MQAFIAELTGTTILILLGNGVVANVVLKGTKGNDSGWIVITLGWAMAVFCGVFIAAPVSGAHLNPAVSIGLAVIGKFPWASVPEYVAAQLAGAMLGSSLVWLFYKRHFEQTTDADGMLAVFCTGPAIRSTSSNLFSEAIGAFVLLFAALHISGKPEYLGSMDALPISFVVLAIGLSLGGTTGYAINPARDLGPRIMHTLLPIKGKRDSDWAYAWIPVAGPILGACSAALLFRAMQ